MAEHSHTPREAGKGDDPATGDELDERIRAYFRDHRMLIHSPVAHSNFRAMAESSGWKQATDAIDDAVGHGATEPTSYAKKVLSGNQAKARLKRAANGESLAPAGPPKPKTVRF